MHTIIGEGHRKNYDFVSMATVSSLCSDVTCSVMPACVENGVMFALLCKATLAGISHGLLPVGTSSLLNASYMPLTCMSSLSASPASTCHAPSTHLDGRENTSPSGTPYSPPLTTPTGLHPLSEERILNEIPLILTASLVPSAQCH